MRAFKQAWATLSGMMATRSLRAMIATAAEKCGTTATTLRSQPHGIEPFIDPAAPAGRLTSLSRVPCERQPS